MKRQHPLLSTLGIILTAVLLTGLGVMLWRSGGSAFSPGRLSAQGKDNVSINGFASHAEFEHQCSLCHAPLKTTMDYLCLECHENIGEQIAAGNGTHGVIAQVNSCMECHEDHNGRDFDMISSALENFDHRGTNFSLVWHQLDYDAQSIECRDCHQGNESFDTSVSSCVNCHTEYAPDFMSGHLDDFGSNCLECHDGLDRMTSFDHASTSFPLEGQHGELSCADCHSSEKQELYLPAAVESSGEGISADVFSYTPTACSVCHSDPAVHEGLFPAECSDCHNPDGWTPAFWEGEIFDHDVNTQFSLVLHKIGYTGSPIRCTGCHLGGFDDTGTRVCISCHTEGEQVTGFMERHSTQFGSRCLDCHDGVDRMSEFDHSQVFTLDGAHRELECASCHIGYEFTNLSRECVDCHAEPEIHRGFFGTTCQNCHSTNAWVPASLRYHDFPLDHGREGQIPCDTCHTETYLDYTCYGCHEHESGEIQSEHLEEGITLSELKDCVECHPTGREEEE